MWLSIKNILRVLFCASYVVCVTEVFKMLVPVFVTLSVAFLSGFMIRGLCFGAECRSQACRWVLARWVFLERCTRCRCRETGWSWALQAAGCWCGTCGTWATCSSAANPASSTRRAASARSPTSRYWPRLPRPLWELENSRVLINKDSVTAF